MSDVKRRRRWPFVLGGLLLVIGIGVSLFRWDWLIPVVNAQASAALGRPVTVTHLRVRLGLVPHIEVDGITIANPADWPGGGNFATIQTLAVDIDAMAYLRGRAIVIPAIAVTRPEIDAQQKSDGQANWTFGTPDAAPSTGPGPTIGALRITDGRAHVRSEKLAADFNIEISTKDTEGQPSQIVASAKGTYAKQAIDAQLTSGALLSLRDGTQPYPIDLKVANGPTRISLTGTVQDPVAFAGADLKLELAGPDMALLLPLTGVAIPKTPPYRIAGRLDYQTGLFAFTGMAGKVGSSDLNGDIRVDTKPARPVLTADLTSKLVDLKDLGGFIGAEPGDADKGTKRPDRSNGRVLPDDRIDLPRLNVADVHLKYRAARIQGRAQPLDNMRADLDIVDGAVSLKPLSFGIGKGQIVADIQMSGQGEGVRARAAIDFQRVEIDRLLNATGVARGAGSIGGRAVIEGTGRSMAEILARGNGELKLYMGSGGNVSALLVNLSGLQFGNALLSALGVPTRAKIQCLITDFVLQQGIVNARTILLDTDEARVGGQGTINLRNESLKLVLETDSKNFSIGSLPAPVDITGTLGSPSVLPDLAVMGARAGAAVGLGILLTPLAALIPTIQLGTGEDGACAGLLERAKTPPRVPP
ncbi:MAG: AsmA family protein, partial [Gemmatimonadaceae bacterium]|nr:AsmA family protein [Acetobacteraceae bacterium]